MENINQLCLIGMMGSGKSTTGKMLSEQLGWKLVDIDEQIVLKNHLSVKEIFSDSEMRFRNLEFNEINENLSRNKTIIVVGGGAVTFQKSYDLLKEMFCIYLSTSVDVLVSRLKGDQSRPLLYNGDKKEMLEEIFYKREKLYTSLSNYEINTDNNSINDNCSKIIGKING